MGIFDLKVRLIPDSSAIRKELQTRQRDGIKRGVGGVAQGATGSAVGAGVGAGIGSGLKISGFGKMLAGVLGITTILTALRPIIEPVMRMLQALLLILFIPLIPFLKPILLILGEMAKKLIPIMSEISKKIEEALKGEGLGAAIEVFFDEIIPIASKGFEKLMEDVMPKLIPILVDGFISFIDALAENSDEVATALIKGIGEIIKSIAGAVKDNWQKLLVIFLVGVLGLLIAGLIGIIVGLSGGWIVALGVAIIFAIVALAKVLHDTWPKLKEKIVTAWNDFISILKSAFSSIVSKIKSFNPFKKKGNSNNVESGGDFILRPNGSLIKTDPRDTIIGFRADKGNPSMSGGNGGGITININNPSVRQESDIRRLADEISRVLATQNRRRFS